MKISFSFLPGDKQRDLQLIKELVLQQLPSTQMIILFGSYARNKYVLHDEQFDFGIHTIFKSDYDILVVTDDKTKSFKIFRKLDKVQSLYDEFHKHNPLKTPLKFILYPIERLNKALQQGRYFEVEIIKDGVLLYDSEKYQLSEPKELDFQEIKKQADEYFQNRFMRGDKFLKYSKLAFQEKDFNESIFFLHQSVENLLVATDLVHTLKSPKEHDLLLLSKSVISYIPEFIEIFLQSNTEDEKLFELLRLAYIEARYNPKFEVFQRDINILLPKIEKLKDIVEKVCKARIEEYKEQ